MTLAMSCKITFPESNGRPELIFRKVNEVYIESSMFSLTDRAKVTLPRIKILDKNTGFRREMKEVFKLGDPIKIELGYGLDERLVEEFGGYITKVNSEITTEISCEDEMWKLKQIKVNYAAANVSLQKLLSDILPNYSIDAVEGFPIGSVRFPNTTVAQVLSKLSQSPWNIKCYMKGKQLVAGKYYSDDTSIPPKTFVIERNVVSTDLTYRNPEERIKIKATSILHTGEKLVCEIGEDGGTFFDLKYCGVEDINLLKKKVQQDYDNAKKGGLQGKFTIIGIPSVRHGMKVKLESTKIPDKNGLYYVSGVVKTYAPSKYRQEIILGGLVS